jgi:hypothetical protein
MGTTTLQLTTDYNAAVWNELVNTEYCTKLYNDMFKPLKPSDN